MSFFRFWTFFANHLIYIYNTPASAAPAAAVAGHCCLLIASWCCYLLPAAECLLCACYLLDCCCCRRRCCRRCCCFWLWPRPASGPASLGCHLCWFVGCCLPGSESFIHSFIGWPQPDVLALATQDLHLHASRSVWQASAGQLAGW